MKNNKPIKVKPPGVLKAIKRIDTNDAVKSQDRPSISIDVDYYQSIIDDPSVSEDRKRELIEIIGRLVVQFIDLGFGVHPVQQAQAENTRRSGTPSKATKERDAERSAV